VSLLEQSTQPGRTTLLEAVNTLLANIGEAPVLTLEENENSEVAVARRTIAEIHKEGQTRGWTWNRETDVEFTRDAGTLEVSVPAAVVLFAPDPYCYAGRYQLRGQRIYDLQERSFQIQEPSIRADIVTLLSWDESPEVFNRWATIRAARVFSDRVLGSDQIFKYTLTDEQNAWLELIRAETEQLKPNALTGTRGLQPFPTFIAARGLLGRRTTGRLFRG
jgi:hypothetical protein